MATQRYKHKLNYELLREPMYAAHFDDAAVQLESNKVNLNCSVESKWSQLKGALLSDGHVLLSDEFSL